MLAIAAILAVLLVAYVGSNFALRLDSEFSSTGVGYMTEDGKGNCTFQMRKLTCSDRSLTLQTQI